MLVLIFRVVILYILAIVVMRIMGKREIGQMQPFELALTFIISELLVMPMENTGVPLINGIISVFTITFSQLLFSYLTLKSEKLQELMSGKPTVMLKNGELNEKHLRDQNYNITELLEQLRLNGVDKITDVEYAVLETNGQLSVILKPEKRPVTVEDMNIQKEYEGIPVDVILDGKIISENLSRANVTEKEVRKEISKNKLSVENVFLATVNAKKEFHIQAKKEVKKKWIKLWQYL